MARFFIGMKCMTYHTCKRARGQCCVPSRAKARYTGPMTRRNQNILLAVVAVIVIAALATYYVRSAHSVPSTTLVATSTGSVATTTASVEVSATTTTHGTPSTVTHTPA